jgi:hypothetical protein
LDKLDDVGLRDWYPAEAVTHGWSRAVLEHHIKTVAHAVFGTAPTNFERVLCTVCVSSQGEMPPDKGKRTQAT